MPKQSHKPKKRRRRRGPRITVPVDKYYCNHCKKDHWKGITPKNKFKKHYIMFRNKPNEKLLNVKEEIQQPLPKVSFTGKVVELDKFKRSEQLTKFYDFIKSRIVGQDHAIESLTNLSAKINADICDRWKPRGIYLFLGPTGVGKTRIAEALAEYYFHSRQKMVKINCGEMSTMFSFKKFGGRLFADENLARQTKEGRMMGILLLDEIEKATVLLYKLLLGILDRGTLRVDEEELDLRHIVVIMTSNLGAEEIMTILQKAKNKIDRHVHREMHKAAIKAAQEKFSPEFFNRLDEVVVFNPLLKEHLAQIVSMEIQNVEYRLVARDIRLHCSEKAIDYLLEEGTDVRYGARHLKRTLEHKVVQPIAHMISAGVLKDKTKVRVTCHEGELVFQKVLGGNK